MSKRRRERAIGMDDLFAALAEPAEIPQAAEAKPAARPTAGFVGYDKAGRFVHFCSCGAWASYGIGVKEDKHGQWFCAACKP